MKAPLGLSLLRNRRAAPNAFSREGSQRQTASAAAGSLRGAAAAAAEGPSNWRSAKNAFSEAASIFPLRLLLWDYQGRAALDSWIQRVEIAGAFLVLFCAAKENKLRPAVSASKSLRPCRAEHAAFASQTGLRLKSPTGAFMPCGHRRPFWFSFGRQKRTSLSGKALFQKASLCIKSQKQRSQPRRAGFFCNA